MMTEEKHAMLEDLRELNDYMKRITGDYSTDHVLIAMANVMSEDNLHEILAAISDMQGVTMGYNYYYGDRTNFIDRNFWR